LAELLDRTDPPGVGGRILARDLGELARLDPAELVVEFGLARTSARRIHAAFSLGRAWLRARQPDRPSLRSPRAVFELLQGEARGLEQETFWSLLLDGKQRLRRLVPVSAGTLTASLVHPREVFRAAVREAAAALIVAHNHPSGDPEPSTEDLRVTERLRAAGEVLGIPLQDHVILGDARFVSLRERLHFGQG
jgi:DNA repair protein RadC